MSSSATSLPLRLQAEPHFTRLFGAHSCFLLPSLDETNCCLAVHNNGLLALVSCTPMQSSEDVAQYFTDTSCVDLPRYVLVIPSSSDEAYWTELGSVARVKPSTREIIAAARHSDWTAKEIVNSIQRYYGRQALEPSIRGFLSILEKQFPRNDLYLFELLQNAVDDGASHVQFEQNGNGIVFLHDGRSFTPMDVLGLASVGLSTKTAESAKRTVGFMGIGFKSVYKRFARVVISDAIWRFCFEEPAGDSFDAIQKPAHAWVMEPHWHSDALWDAQPNSATKSWCHFQLERPRGDALKDLRYLPPTVPPLLGKQALGNFRLSGREDVEQWILDWDKRRFTVKSEVTTDSVQSPFSETDKYTACYFEKVTITDSSIDSSSVRYWKFLNLQFVPDAAAQSAYLNHTKKRWEQVSDRNKREEMSFFFEVDVNGAVLAQQKDTGKVHAILPTKLSLPCPISWQGSWLLSVDRQEVQNIFDNNWNKCLVKKATHLMLAVLRYIAQGSSSGNLACAYRLLPAVVKDGNALVTNLLGMKIDLMEVTRAMRLEHITPSLSSASPDIVFSKSLSVLWLPPPLVNRISSKLISAWFGMNILPTHLLGDLAWSPLWLSTVQHLKSSFLVSRKASFCIPSDCSLVDTAISIIRAIGETLQILPPAESSIELPATTSASIFCGEAVPLVDWPVFLPDTGSTLRSAREVSFPGPCFVGVPEEIRVLLRPMMRTGSVSRLHETIETTFINAIEKQKRDDPVLLCYNIVTSVVPENVYSFEKCAKLLFEKWSQETSSSGCSDEITAGCLELFNWAQSKNMPTVVTHTLCVSSLSSVKPKLFLKPTAACYLGECYIGSTGKLIESVNLIFPKAQLFIVSDKYLVGKSYKRAVEVTVNFLTLAGVSKCPRLQAVTYTAGKDELSKIPGGPPKLRQSNPTGSRELPYGLGSIVSRKLYQVVDVQFTPEWTTIITECSNNAILAATIAPVITDMFSNLDCADPASAESTPDCAALLKGTVVDGEASADSYPYTKEKRSQKIVPGSSPFPVWKRLFFFPPGQAGASAIKMKAADWILFLRQRAWIPGASCQSQDLVLSPPEVSFDVAQDGIPHAVLPVSAIAKMKALPAELLSEFAFGTVKPRPPLEKFVQICNELCPKSQEKTQVLCDPDITLYQNLVSIWKSILLNLNDGVLSKDDTMKVATELKRGAPVIPGKDSKLYPLSYIVDIDDSGSPYILSATKSLVKAGYLLDVKSIPEFRGLLSIVSVSKVANEKVLENYLRLCPCEPLPSLLDRQRLIDLLLCYSHCLRGLIGSERWSPALQIKFEKSLPELAVLCSSWAGPKGFTMQWRRVFVDIEDTSSVSPVVIDDITRSKPVGCGYAKSSVLLPTHKFHPILLLNSFSSKDLALVNPEDCEILPQLLPRIGLPSISDNKLFNLRTKTNGEPRFLEGATSRFKIVLLLLCNFHSIRPAIASNGKSLDLIVSLKLFRYGNIELLFKTPKLSESELLSKNAVWGPPKLVAENEKQTYSGCILLTKAADDYIADLEELVVTYLSGFVNFDSQNKNSLRAMKLLGHVESAEQFMKFLSRDFGKQFDFENPVGGSTESQLGDGDENVAVENIQSLLYASVASIRPKTSHPISGKRSVLSQDVNDDDDDDCSRAQKLIKSDLEDVPTIAPSEGRGRGISILPAWVTQPETRLGGIDVSKHESTAVQGDIGSIPSPSSSGRGRGLSILPAWMTTQDKADGSVQFETVPSETQFEGVVPAPNTSVSTAHVEVGVGKMLPMAGRGRGITILPAWMTAPVATNSEPTMQDVTDAVENTISPAVVDRFLDSCLIQAISQQETTGNDAVLNGCKRMREEEDSEVRNVIMNDVTSEKKTCAQFLFKESIYIKISDETTALVSRFLFLLSSKGSSLEREMILSLCRSRLVEAIVKYISGNSSTAGGQQEQKSNCLLQELRDACLALELNGKAN